MASIELPVYTALLLVDVQQGFDDPAWGKRNNPGAEEKIAELVGAWREAHRPVVHIMHDSRSETSLLHPQSYGNALKPEIAPLPGEPLYHKSVNSSFIGTTLESDLRNDNTEALVIVGLTTKHCVSTTARMAGDLGFQTYVVSDATATFERAGLDDRMRPAAEVHASASSDLDG